MKTRNAKRQSLDSEMRLFALEDSGVHTCAVRVERIDAIVVNAFGVHIQSGLQEKRNQVSLERSLRDKAEYRSMCRSYRASLDGYRYASLSDSIVRRALSNGVFDAFRLIHVYWPIIERREIDTRPLIAALQEAGKQVVIPAVDPNADRAAGRMICRAFTGVENLRKNAWGTNEPTAGEPVPHDRIELVVAPALGADRSGFRLGYGGGFYDRFLKETDCPALSLVYSECLFDSVPNDPHDVKVDLIVTEDELVSPGNLQPRGLPDRN